MITTEKIESLDGSISIPTSQLLYFKDSKIVSGSGASITLTGSSSSGGTSGGGTTPPTKTPTEIQDLTLEYTPIAVDAAVNNTIEIDQDSGQANFTKYQFILTQQDFTLTADSMTMFPISKIQMNVQSAGYQLCKILMYDDTDTLITFSRVDADTVQKVSNNTVKIDVTSSGFTLVTNATYELANIFNTDKMPVAATSGWYALTSSTDATANFTAVFSAPVNVAKIRVYRCGAASTSFNGGTADYIVKISDDSSNTLTVNVPKVDNTVFTSLTDFTSSTLGTAGTLPAPETKLHKFTLGVSTDGVNFTNISADGVMTYVQNTTTGAYTATQTFPMNTINSAKVFFKIPDADIAYLKNVKINMWRTELI